MTTKRGSIVLADFIYDDLTGVKERPALCITGRIGSYQHVTLAYITTAIPNRLLSSDLLIDPQKPEFATTGLNVRCIIRLHRLMTVRASILSGQVGQICTTTQTEVDNRLRTLFKL